MRGRLSFRVEDNSRRVVARPSDEVEELDVLRLWAQPAWSDPISRDGETMGYGPKCPYFQESLSEETHNSIIYLTSYTDAYGPVVPGSVTSLSRII